MDPIFNKAFVDKFMTQVTLDDLKGDGDYNLKFSR